MRFVVFRVAMANSSKEGKRGWRDGSTQCIPNNFNNSQKEGKKERKTKRKGGKKKKESRKKEE